MNKDEYILRSLSKIKHKKWENFIITRIIHFLNDPSIEFVCQQYVRRPESKRAHTDLFFPQFDIHLEINEKYHSDDEQEKKDFSRSRDIVDATGHEVIEINTYEKMDGNPDKSLAMVIDETDAFVSKILELKNEYMRKDLFSSWDFGQKFQPSTYISKGKLDLGDAPVFRTHVDALKCFGFTGKSHMRGTWTIPGTKTAVWFPKLYENNEWKNSISTDGQVIKEVFLGDKRKSKDGNEYSDKWKSRVVFAHYTDNLGDTLYRFLGEFEFDVKLSRQNKCSVFLRIATSVPIIGSHMGSNA